ncbi:MAG: hypothetical protein FD143_3104 [Ignavibacteria bacterium]|nr:MAG: hypothetical protein FD143_3104 [Ignavibacteria bacterium]
MEPEGVTVEGNGIGEGGGLTTTEIDVFLRNYFSSFNSHIHYLGTFPIDQYPHQKFTQPLISSALCCVVNIDPSCKPGKHWVALYREKDAPGQKQIEFFDSYGYPPTAYNFESFICMSIISNTQCLQSYATNVCGQYCILFLLLRFASINLPNVRNRFKNVIDFLLRLSEHSPLNRDISVKRIYEKNRTLLTHQIRQPLSIYQKHFTLPPMRLIQRSFPFHAHTTTLLSNSQIDSV